MIKFLKIIKYTEEAGKIDELLENRLASATENKDTIDKICAYL